MKKYLFLITVSLFFLSQTGDCQPKVDRFCVIHAKDWTPNFATFKKVTVDYGQVENQSKFRDTSETARLELAKKCKTETDMLNYMASIGWTLVNTREPYGLSAVILVFKKSFDAAEIVDNNN